MTFLCLQAVYTVTYMFRVQKSLEYDIIKSQLEVGNKVNFQIW